MAVEVDEVMRSAAFEASALSLLIVDRRLRIRAVNAAFVQATGHPAEAVVGRDLFAAFPANPADPDGDGAARMAASFEAVLAGGRRHAMGLQRYDVVDPADPQRFRYKVWAPVHSPIRDGRGRTVGVLGQAEEVTELILESSSATPAGTGGGVGWGWLLRALRQEQLVSQQLQQEVEALREALHSNRLIGQAIGLLMAESEGRSAEEAFELLRSISARTHRKLRDVAELAVNARTAPAPDTTPLVTAQGTREATRRGH